MKRAGIALLGVVTVALLVWIGIAADRHFLRPREDRIYVELRKATITTEAKRIGRTPVLLVGDSITEQSGIVQLCGQPTFVAGVSSARLDDLDDLAEKLAAPIRPKAVFLAIGTNDARRALLTPVGEWKGLYERLVLSLAPAQVVVVLPPAIERGKTLSGLMDVEHLSALNRALAVVAHRTKAIILPQPRVQTGDGIHPTDSGAAAWRAELESVCGILPLRS